MTTEPREICEVCRRPWQGTRSGTYHDELRQQDHKGPQDALFTNCCGRKASGWAGVRPIANPRVGLAEEKP